MAAALDRGRADVSNVGHVTQELYTRYGRQIYAYCMQQLHSREEAEDAVQTTFLNAFRGLQGGTVAQCEQAWLYKIAHNVCVARRMSTGRRLRLESPSDFEVLQETVASPRRTGDVELIGLEDALEAMPANQRRAILLREWQGLTYREIAEELGLSQASVEMLIFRARRALAHALEEPAAPKKQRVSRGLGLGSLLAAIKSMLGGGTTIKAVAIAVTATATALGGAVQHTVARPHVAASAVTALADAQLHANVSAHSAATSASVEAATTPATRALPHTHVSGIRSPAAPAEAAPPDVDVAVPAPEPVAPEPPATPVAVETPNEPLPTPTVSTPTTTNTAAAPTPPSEVAPPQQPAKPRGDEQEPTSRSDKVKPKDARQTAIAIPPPPSQEKGNDKGNGKNNDNGKGHGNAAPVVPTLSSATAPSPPDPAAVTVTPGSPPASPPPTAPVVPPGPAALAPESPAPTAADEHGNGKGKSKAKDK
jgi:RNA polymerase sigma factor (sigma-70 family)